jgi:hypothetical protein
MNWFGGGYHPTRQGHGVYQNPSWSAISQNQSFLEPWSHIPQPALASHARNAIQVTAIHTGIISPTSSSHVGDRSTTFEINVEDQQPTNASHVGGTNIVTSCHTTHTPPTSTSHVGGFSTTSTSHVEDKLLAFEIHARSMSPDTSSHAGGIHMIDKPQRIGFKPKFLCSICKGYHLNRVCHATTVVQEAWSLSGGPPGSGPYLVSQPSLLDTKLVPMKYSVDTTLVLGGDASLDHVVLHPI